MERKLRAGNVTTISVSPELKRRIDRLKGDATYQEFFADLFRKEVVDGLDELRAPGETYGDVIVAVTGGGGRDPGELKLLIESALSRVEVEPGGVLKARAPWEKR